MNEKLANGVVGMASKEEEIKSRFERAVLVFDTLSLNLYRGLDFRLKLVEDPEALDLAEKLMVKLNRQ